MPLILDGTTGASLIATTAIPASVVLSTPASGTMTNVTSVPAAQLTGTVAVANGGTGGSTSTGTGAVVLGTSPTLTTPALGTPASGVLTNCTGLPALSTASGSAPSYSARAWVNFNGQGTIAIRASANVSSITDNGTGNYTVNFTTAMTDVNYVATALVSDDSTANRGVNIQGDNTTNFLTSGYRINIFANADPFWVCTLAIR